MDQVGYQAHTQTPNLPLPPILTLTPNTQAPKMSGGGGGGSQPFIGEDSGGGGDGRFSDMILSQLCRAWLKVEDLGPI